MYWPGSPPDFKIGREFDGEEKGTQLFVRPGLCEKSGVLRTRFLF